MSEVVCVSYRHEVPTSNLPGNNLPGLPQLFEKLRDRDLEPVLSFEAEAAFVDDEIQTHELIEDGVSSYLGRVTLSHVGVMLNRFDRSIKMDLLPRPELLPAVINENATRSLAFRKQRMHDEVLNPVGIAIPTALLESREDITRFLSSTEVSSFIIKPNSGTNSRGIKRVERDRVYELFDTSDDLYGKEIIQSAYDFSVPFPSDLRPFDRTSSEAFEGWSKSHTSKELRVYGFHDPTDTQVFPVARAINNGDQWFFVDPESVPEGVLESSRQAIAKAAEVSGAAALYGTVDLGYGSDGTGGPEWKAIELNARMPYLIGYDKHPEVADTLRDYFANQIHATAVAA